MSRTLSLQIPDAVFEALERIAQQEGASAESLGATWLAAAIERISRDPLTRVAGTMSSGTPDLADRHDSYIAQELDNEASGRG